MTNTTTRRAVLVDGLIALVALAAVFVDSWARLLVLGLLFLGVRVYSRRTLPRWLDVLLVIGVGAVLLERTVGGPRWFTLVPATAIIIVFGAAVFYFARGVFDANRGAMQLRRELDSLDQGRNRHG